MPKIKRAIKKIYALLPFKRPIYSLIKTFYTLPHGIYKHLYFRGWFRVKAGDSEFLLYHHGYQIENEIFWNGLDGWEGLSFQLWMKLSKISEVVIDIGANTGVFALITKSINPKTTVLAYEPVTRVYKKLIKNIEKNQFDIRAEEIAISNYEGKATIYDQPTEHIYSVTVNKNLAEVDSTVIPTSVVTKRLSTIIEENNLKKVDLIKIDVETHEPEVLEGMGKYLNLFKPILLIEVLNDDVALKLNNILQNLDYEYYCIFENTGLKKVDQISFSDHQGYNYLLLPISRKNDVKEIILSVDNKGYFFIK